MKAYLNTKTLWGALGVLCCVLIAFVLEPPALLAEAALAQGSTPHAAMVVLGVLAWAICWWIGAVMPDWATAVGMLLLWTLFGACSFGVSFAAFSGTTLWLFIGAFAVSTAVTKTGLLHRISLSLMRLFPPSYAGQMAAMLAVGTTCATLIPSTTAKAVLGANMANATASAMGYENDSKGRCGLFLASWTGFALTAPAFINGSVNGYALIGALPEQYQPGINWTSWFVAMLPWLVLMLAGMSAAILLLYRPKESSSMTKAHVTDQLAALGPMSGKERITVVILGSCLLLWVLESVVGVAAAIVALAGGLCCFGFRVLEPKEIATAVPWSMILFVGSVLNVGNVFGRVGVNVWMQGLLAPVFLSLSSTLMLVLVVAVAVVAVRFLLVSQAATTTLFISVLSPIAVTLGIHPFILGLVVYTMLATWFFPYQNVVFAPAFACMNGTLSYGKTVPSCFIYVAVALGACLLCLPWWGVLGYL